MSSVLSDGLKPVLHVVVIGFHHKKGCQIEFSYPPLKTGGEVYSNECPPEWKNLPSLAVPDGAHNYIKAEVHIFGNFGHELCHNARIWKDLVVPTQTKFDVDIVESSDSRRPVDTIYFHLPGREGTHRTVYGVACYRQIDAKELKIKTDDITRSTVQKSVCVLSNLPLYGLIQAKLELITHAYFKELDFSRVSLLKETYNNLNASLTESLLDGGSQVYLGMDVKNLVQTFKHKVLVLFKLIMLERRVLFTGTPVEKLGNTILSVLSLYPGMIEHGLVECTAYGVHRQISPTMASTNVDCDSDDFLEIRYTEETSPEVDQFNSNEPESPTIDRGGEKLLKNYNTLNSIPLSESNSSSLHSANNKNRNTVVTHRNSVDTNVSSSTDNEEAFHYVDDYYAKDGLGNVQKVVVNTDRGVVKHVHTNEKVKVHRQMSDTTNSRVRVHSNTSDTGKDSRHRNLSDSGEGRANISKDSFEKNDAEKMFQSCGSQQQVMMTGKPEEMLGLAHYEAVQAGKNIPKNGSLIDMEHCSLELKEDYFSSQSPTEAPIPAPDPGKLELVSVLSNSGLPIKSFGVRNESIHPEKELDSSSEKVDELDTPESINQIDQEDCFSWEDDKLALTIDTEKTDHRLDDMAGLASSFKEISVLEHLPVSKVEMKKGATDDPIPKLSEGVKTSNISSSGAKASDIKNRLTNAFGGLSLKGKLRKSMSRDSNDVSNPVLQESSTLLPPLINSLPVLQQDDLGFPLAIFTKGCVCFPYLSLQYFDVLNDVNIRSFLIGATNMLFRHKHHLTDVVVDVSENKIDMHDKELQKQLMLTTADLRFTDILVKGVTEGTEDNYFEGTEWEGNDEWLRAQFKLYLEGMLAAVLTDDAKLIEDFGVSFIHCWKTTHNYKVWSSMAHKGFKDIPAGHPYQGHLSMADIKVRFSHTMNNTEGGKKINAAVSTTGKYVVQTGKAVGGALTQAKSSLSSWFSNWKTSNEKETKDVAEIQS